MQDKIISKFFSMVMALLLIIAGFIFFGPLTAILTPIAIFLWLEAVVRSRRERGRRMVAYLEYAVRLNVPLPTFLRAAAAGEKGGFSARIAHLAQWLERGSPLADALRITMPEVSSRQRELIGAAERTGRLSPTLTNLTQQTLPMVKNNPGSGWMSWIYPLLMAYLMTVILLFTFVFVIPKFREIFADFDTELPYSTRLLLSILTSPNDEHPGFGFELLAVVLAFVAVVIWLGSTTWAVEKLWKLPTGRDRSLADWWREIVGGLPLIGRLVRDQQMADVCYTIGSALDGALPLPSAIREAQTLQLSPSLRDKLTMWADRANSGRPIGHAAGDAGMPPLMVGMLSGTEGASQPGQTLTFLYRYYRNRFSRAAELLRGAVVPAMVLLLGGIVGFVIVALFLPLISLIDSLMRNM